jgi:hypothetical protein
MNEDRIKIIFKYNRVKFREFIICYFCVVVS